MNKREYAKANLDWLAAKAEEEGVAVATATDVGAADENQTSQYGGYLIFAVPGTAKIFDAGFHTVMNWIVCINLWNCYRMSSE